MRKIYLFLLFSFTLASCGKEVPFVDFNFSSEIEIISGEIIPDPSSEIKKIYLNSPIVASIKVSGADALNMELSIKYQFIKGAGTIVVNGSSIAPNTPSIHTFKNGDYNLTFTPSATGENEILFIIGNDKHSEQITFKTNVVDLEYTATATALPESILLDNPSTITLNAYRQWYTGSLTVNYVLLSGQGVLKNGTTIIATNQSFIVQNNVPTTLQFTPTQAGESKIQFTIKDSNNNSKEVVVTVTGTDPQYTATAVALPQSVLLDNPSTITLSAYRQGYTGTLTANYVLLSGQGVLKNGAATIATNQSFTIQNNIPTTLQFTPTQAGENKIQFTIKDSNNNSKEVVVSITGTDPEYTATATVLPESVLLDNPSTITLNVYKQGHTGNLTANYVLLSGRGTLRNGAATIAANQSFTVQNNVPTTLQFTPTQAGENKIQFTIKDSNNNSKEVVVSIIGTEPEYTATATALPQSVILDNPSTITLSAYRQGYTGALSVNYVLLSGQGVLKNGAATIANNQSFTVQNSIPMALQFTPTRAGENKIQFTVKDSNNNSKEIVVTVIGMSPEYAVSATALPESVLLDNSSTITLNAYKQGYTGTFTVNYVMLSGQGILKNGAATIATNQALTAQNDVPMTLQFIPTQAGENKIQFIVKDANNNTKETTVSITGVDPEYTVTSSALPQSVLLEEPSTITLKAYRQGYTGTLTVNYVLLSGQGVLKNGNTTIATSQSFTIQNNVPASLQFTPTRAGESKIQFIVKDANNNTKETTVTITGVEPQYTATATALPESVLLDNPSTITYKVYRQGYTGTLTVSYVLLSGQGVFKNGNTTITSSQSFTVQNNVPATLQFTPTRAGENKIQLIVKDANNNTKETTISITGIEPQYTATATAAPQSVVLDNPSTITLKAYRQGYTGTLTVNYVLLSGQGVLKNGNSTIAANQSFTIQNNVTTTLQFTPTKIGENKIQFVVKDANNNTKEATVSITGEKAPITVSSSSPATVQMGAQTAFNLILNEAYYTGDFQITHAILSGAGTLKKDAGIIDPGLVVNLPVGTHPFTFVPSKVGDNVIQFTVKDSYNQTKTINVTAKATALPITATATTIADGLIHIESPFNLTIGAPSSTENLTVEYKVTSGSGVLKYGAQTISNNTSFSLPAGMSALTFAPTTVGENTFTLTVKDAYGQSKVVTVRAKGNPASIQEGSPPINLSGSAHESLGFQLSPGEKFYTGSFSVTFRIVSGQGELKVGETTYQSNSTFNLSSTEISYLYYTAKSLGNSSFQLTIRDTHGQQLVKDISVTNITPYQVTVTPVYGITGTPATHSYRPSVTSETVTLNYLKDYTLSLVLHTNKPLPLNQEFKVSTTVKNVGKFNVGPLYRGPDPPANREPGNYPSEKITLSSPNITYSLVAGQTVSPSKSIVPVQASPAVYSHRVGQTTHYECVLAGVSFLTVLDAVGQPVSPGGRSNLDIEYSNWTQQSNDGTVVYTFNKDYISNVPPTN